MSSPVLAARRGFASVARVLAVVGLATATAQAASTVAPSPALPLYGQPIALELRSSEPYFLPTVRYVRQGNSITADFEAPAKAFGPFPPNLGTAPLPLGELPPGNYTVTARVIDIDDPNHLIDIATSQMAVVPPNDYGVYPVPSAPHAYENLALTIRSAAYFDPATMRASVDSVTHTIRVDFDYLAAFGASPSAGMQTWGSVSVGAPAPGTWHLEAWGRPNTGGAPEKYFSRDVVVSTPSVVYEYYHDKLDHYFIGASVDEVALLDAGGQGGWKRTGQTFHAWLKASDAPPQAVPVCRFYAAGPNSHFYTADANECAGLRALEQSQRADATAQGKAFLGWGYEGVAFYALQPQNGQCPASTTPVARLYNGRAAENDSNHRFTADPGVQLSMVGWTLEGVAFCSPS